jgi:hypothetical protein
MEHESGLEEVDISGSGCRVTCTGMEYSDGKMEENILDSRKRIRLMVMDISRILLAQNIIHSGRMINEMETQLKLRMGNYTHANLRKIRSYLKLKYTV